MILSILLVIITIFSAGSYILNEKWLMSTLIAFILLGMTLSYSYGYGKELNAIETQRELCIEEYEKSDKETDDKARLVSELQKTNVILEEMCENENYYIITDICWMFYERKAEDYVVEFGERTISIPEFEEIKI